MVECLRGSSRPRHWQLEDFASSVSKHDEAHDRGRRKAFSRACRAALLPVALYGLYFAHRALCLNTLYRRGQRNGIACSAGFLIVEVCFSAPLLLTCATAIAALKALHVRPTLRLAGQHVPSVDVFITCRHEPVTILLDTLRAACALDYPVDRYRVIVLDDGKSRDVKNAVGKTKAEFASTGPLIWYSTRDMIAESHGKKHNMQHGLEVSATLPGGRGAVAGFLDVDMIPDPWWLRVTIPHLIVSSKTALVNPPQDFYNLHKISGIPAPLDWFFEWHAVMLDSLGFSLCTGSGIVIRRSALDEVGGFLTCMQQEDVAIPKALRAAGWSCAQINEDVQCGLMPEGFWGQARQRKQWIRGWLDDTVKRLHTGTFLEKLSAFHELFFGLGVYFQPAIIVITLGVLLPTAREHLVVSGGPTDGQTVAGLFLFAKISAWYFGLHKADASSWRLNAIEHGIDSWLWPLLPDVVSAAVTAKRVQQQSQTYHTAGDVRPEAEKRQNVRSSAWRYYAVVAVVILPLCLACHTGWNPRQQYSACFVLIPPQLVEMYWAVFSSILPAIQDMSRTSTPIQRESMLARDRKSSLAYPLTHARYRRREAAAFGKYYHQTVPLMYAAFYWLSLVKRHIYTTR